MEKGSELGVKTAATTTMMMTAHLHDRSSRAGVTTRASSSDDQDDGELEGEPEDRHHQQDQPEVRDRIVDRLQVRAADRLQPAEGVGQRDVRSGRAEQEEHERAEHERDGVPALGRLEPGGHEPPDLEEDDRRRQDEAAEERDLDAQGEPVQGRRDEEVAGAVGGDRSSEPPVLVWCRVRGVDAAQRAEQEVQDRLVGEDGDRGGDHEGDHADDDPAPQLAQVLPEGHVVRRRAALALGREGEGHHACAPSVQSRVAGHDDLGRLRWPPGAGHRGRGRRRGRPLGCPRPRVAGLVARRRLAVAGDARRAAPEAGSCRRAPRPDRRRPRTCSRGGSSSADGERASRAISESEAGRAWSCAPRSPCGAGTR